MCTSPVPYLLEIGNFLLVGKSRANKLFSYFAYKNSRVPMLGEFKALQKARVRLRGYLGNTVRQENLVFFSWTDLRGSNHVRNSPVPFTRRY